MESGANKVLFVTGGYDFTVKLWRTQSGTVLKNFQHKESAVNCLSIGPSKRFIYSGGHCVIYVYDKEASSVPILTFDNFPKNITDLKCNSEESWILTSGEDGCLRIWDIRSKKGSQLKLQSDFPQNSCCIHPNDIIAFSGDSDGKVNIWDIRAGVVISLVHEKYSSVNSICIDRRSTMLAAIGNSGSCSVWGTSNRESYNETDFQLIKQFKAHEKYGLGCVFNPNTSQIATCSADNTAKIWNISDFSLNSLLTCPKQRWIWDCSFSADSQYLMTVSSDSLPRLWHAQRRQVIRDYLGHQSAVISMDFCDEFY